MEFVAIVVAAGSCDRSFHCDCSQHIPSRGADHAKHEQLCPGWQTRICLVRIPHRRATPSNASCELAWIASSRHIHGPPRVGPYGRDLELPAGNSDRTTADESEFLVSPICFTKELVEPLRRRPRIGPSPLPRVDARAEARGAAPLSSPSGGSPRAYSFRPSLIHGTRHTSFGSLACAR